MFSLVEQSTGHRSATLEDTDKMADDGRKQLHTSVMAASEVALTLVYVDGSSQLRELNQLVGIDYIKFLGPCGFL